MLSAIAVPDPGQAGRPARPPPDAARRGRDHGRGEPGRPAVRAVASRSSSSPGRCRAVYTVWLPLQVALIYDRARGLPDAAAQTRRATGLIVAALQSGAIVGALAGGHFGTALVDQFWLVPAGARLARGGRVRGGRAPVPESEDRRAGQPSTPGGAALLSVVLLVVTGGLTFVRINGADKLWPWLLVIALGLLLLVPFVRYELGRADPLIDIRVLRSPAMWPVQLTAGPVRRERARCAGAAVDVRPHRPEVYGYGLGLSTSDGLARHRRRTSSRMLAGACQFARISRPHHARGRRSSAPPSSTGTGYLLLVPFHGSLGRRCWPAWSVAGLGVGALVAALPAAAAAAAPAGRHRRGHRPHQHDQGPRRQLRLGDLRAGAGERCAEARRRRRGARRGR